MLTSAAGTGPASGPIGATMPHALLHRLAVLAAGCAVAVGALSAAAPAQAAAPRAADLLAGLTTAARGSAAGYATGFRYWVAADTGCRTPRVQVLAQRSATAVKPGGCSVTTGRWTSAFTGARLTSTRTAQVQWTVPLQQAWQSGAAGWSALRRQAFANDVGYTGSLLVVDAASAQRRGQRDPAGWMPVAKLRCTYAKSWIAVKSRWGLTVTAAERSALAAALKRYCRTAPTVASPGGPDVAALTGTAAQPASTAPSSPASSSPAPSSPAPSAPPSSVPSASPPVAPSPAPAADPAPTPSASPTTTPAPTATPTPAATPACSTPSSPGTALLPLLAATRPGSVLTLPAGTVDFADFTAAPWGVDVPTSVPGIAGAAGGGTVVQLRTCTSTHAADVPTATGTTNQLSLLRVSGSPVLSDLTLQGTEQGHRYNGLRLNQTLRAVVQRVAVRGVPGNSDVNPGETFGINDYRGNGTRYDHVLVDGQGVGASGLGLNSASDVTVADSAFTGNRYSAGVAIWQTADVTIDRSTFSGNRTGVNLERATGTVTLDAPTFSGNGTDVRLASDLPATATVVITDPVITAADGRLRIRCAATYRGLVNTQVPADVHVLRNGVDVTASTVTWVP